MNRPATTEAPSQRRLGMLEIDADFVEDVAVLVDADQHGMVLNLTSDLHPADLAQLLGRLSEEQAYKVFAWLPDAQASDVLVELTDGQRTAVLQDLQAARLRVLIDALDTDDAADVLNDMSDAQALGVLPDLEDTHDVAVLLEYDEESAGGIMAREFVSVPPTWTLEHVIEAVRAHATDIDDIYSVFVLGDNDRLEGVVSLKDLMLAPAEDPVRTVMHEDFISVPTDMDREEVARIMERYDLVSMPVVDSTGGMVGRITIDDVVDVIREEAEEDIQIMSGGSGIEQPDDTVWRVSRGRLPWLLVGLFGAGLSGSVIGGFEVALEQAVVLAMFIPIVTAMGGNAAVQSAAIAVQGLSSGDLWMGDIGARILKEMVVALINGVVLAALLCIAVFVFQLGDVPLLALTLGATMLTVIVLATTNGALVPFALKWLGIDPASAMGPFVTTLNDIIGLTVYFIYATTLYLG
ncbi:MAG: magnesium transporter [Longimonas sp.]|uniref:magnesium transporter n=1 Tax=Longimonas sp. TaxID=2039626 RepID=UPI003347BC8E